MSWLEFCDGKKCPTLQATSDNILHSVGTSRMYYQLHLRKRFYAPICQVPSFFCFTKHLRWVSNCQTLCNIVSQIYSQFALSEKRKAESQSCGCERSELAVPTRTFVDV